MTTTDTPTPVTHLNPLVAEHERYGGGPGGNPRLDPALNEARVRVRLKRAPWNTSKTPVAGHLIEDDQLCDVVMYRSEFDAFIASGVYLADADEPQRQAQCRQRYIGAICKRDGVAHRKLVGVSEAYEDASTSQIMELYARYKASPAELEDGIRSAFKYAEDTQPFSVAAMRHAMVADGEARLEAGMFTTFEAVEALPPPKSTIRAQHEQGAREAEPILAAAVAKAVAEQLAAVFGPLLAQINPNGKSKGG